MFDKDGQYVVKLLEEVSCSLERSNDRVDRYLQLLPMSFGPEDLKGARTV